MRVWSTDWWVDAVSTLNKLAEKLRLLLLVDLARIELVGSGVSHQGTTVAMAPRLGIARLSPTSGERLGQAVLIAEKLLGI